ncbi:marine proteobacterial sortase target protein [Steroidobacter agaridevorans]|uniref:Marine proteobacterial sortase target protein n=1 Tax=Steroidobacter agaridevorans TaxID=2695856 RepID=A0A829YQ95_9GAMM|nr:marine proteobacterial sortase target protein [Steroidobacter agaridevorans]GFE84953.1 marine proteobacterial sortase target protein [Steroidobacter agaridevorans]
MQRNNKQRQPRFRAKAEHSFAALFCLWILLAVAPITQAQTVEQDIGSGSLTLRDDQGRAIDAPRMETAVRMKVSGIVARVEVSQRFHNESDAWVEGVYAFPLPEHSAVDTLRMKIGERIIVGEIREKEQAQKIFEQARQQGQRASVVHQQRPNLFRTAVANIGPGETIEIVIGYLQIVDQDAGRYALRFPLTITPRYIPGVDVNTEARLTSETPIAALTLAVPGDDTATLGDLQPRLAHAHPQRQSVSMEIDIDAGAPMEHITSPYHPILVDATERGAQIKLRNQQSPPDRDFELSWAPVVKSEPAIALFREPTDQGEHVLLMFMPPQESRPINTPREVIFVIDTSGSMSGESINQARAALMNGLRTLQPADRFTVIQFNSVHEALFDEPVSASEENLSRAQRYVRNLHATGGTEMLPALLTALSMPESREHLRQVIFITDAAVGNEDQLMLAIRQQLGSARLFTVGIGSAPNGHFLRNAARTGRGTFTYIGSIDEVESKMTALLNKLTSPVLTDIELNWPAGVVPEYAPASIGDLYAGEPIVVTARLQSPAKGTLSISGRTNGTWTRQISLNGMQPRTGVASLWARNRIGDLMDSRANGATDDSIRGSVLPLALQYQLVSNYTSLVAVDRTPARPDGESLHSRRIPNTKPNGLDWPAEGVPSTATPAQLNFAIGALLLLAALGWQLRERRLQRRQPQ